MSYELVKGVEKKNKKSLKVSKGKIRLPVRGEIISNYGEGKDSRNSKDGLVFKVFKESFVTSPINGMVVYANQFRSYGNLIIIENNDGAPATISDAEALPWFIKTTNGKPPVKSDFIELYLLPSRSNLPLVDTISPLSKNMSVTG